MLPEASASADQIATALFNYSSTDDYKVCISDPLSSLKCSQKQNDMLTSLISQAKTPSANTYSFCDYHKAFRANMSKTKHKVLLLGLQNCSVR